MNLRFFSPRYHDESQPTRAWLNDYGPDEASASSFLWTDWPSAGHASLQSLISRWQGSLPIYRYRQQISALEATVIGSSGSNSKKEHPNAEPELSSYIRVAAHYSNCDASPNSAQIRALLSIRSKITERNRKALFFLTPLNPEFVSIALPGDRYGASVGAVSRVLDPYGGFPLGSDFVGRTHF